MLAQKYDKAVVKVVKRRAISTISIILSACPWLRRPWKG